MKADLALIGTAAAGLLLIPMAVLAVSGIPLGEATSLGAAPAGETPPAAILPADPADPEAAPPEAELPLVRESFLILDETSGAVEEVNALDYVTGAIAAEMPASYEADALIAQGIASYTNAHYLAALRQQNPEENLKGADFSADPTRRLGYITRTEMKVMWGKSYDLYYNKVRAAAETAVQHLLTYEDEPILAAYFAISAGKTTEDAANVWQTSLPYLIPVESHWDENSSGYESTVTIPEAELRQKLSAEGILTGKDPAAWLKILARSEAGYVTSVQAGDRVLTGQQLRNILGLRSSAFTFTYEKKSFTFTVLGYGHGVGLSQVGAQQMALAGSSYAQILAHYYPGTALQKVSK